MRTGLHTWHVSGRQVSAALAQVDAREGSHGVVNLAQQLPCAQIGVAQQAPRYCAHHARACPAPERVPSPAQIRERCALQAAYPTPLRDLEACPLLLDLA